MHCVRTQFRTFASSAHNFVPLHRQTKSETQKSFVFKVNVLMVLGYDYFELCCSFTRKERSSHSEERMLKSKRVFTPRK